MPNKINIKRKLLINDKEKSLGINRTAHLKLITNCGYCEGKGYLGNESQIICPQCKGKSSVINQGFFVISTCETCNGKGETFKNPCPKCNGRGASHLDIYLPIKLDKDINEGTTISIPQKILDDLESEFYIFESIELTIAFELHDDENCATAIEEETDFSKIFGETFADIIENDPLAFKYHCANGIARIKEEVDEEALMQSMEESIERNKNDLQGCLIFLGIITVSFVIIWISIK